MHYKTKQPVGRLLLFSVLVASLIWILAINRSTPAPEPSNTIPVIKPTLHMPILSETDLGEENPYQELNIAIKSGDTLAKRLAQQNISLQTIHQLLSDPVAAPYLTKIFPGQTLTLSFDHSGELKKLEQKISETHTLMVEEHEGQYKGEVKAEPVTTFIKYSHGKIEDSLFSAGQRAGLDDNTIMELASIFGYDIDFALDIQPGDQFTLLYENRYVDNKQISSGRILAAEFINRERIYSAVRYEDPQGHSAYYTPDGKSLQKAFLRTPVNFSRISSRFSMGRKHPILHTIRAHKGVDYSAPTGTPIKASGHGKVAFVGRKGGYGNCIILQHGQQYTTLYGHMSRFAKPLNEGDRVTQGQIIGYVGMTGLASGPHLHYEFRINGAHVDPLAIKLPASEPIAPQYRNEFLVHANTLMRQMSYQTETELASIGSHYE
jgi:murein DD-endopeptidase MepM/ murein hydrolase activator NlpD